MKESSRHQQHPPHERNHAQRELRPRRHSLLLIRRHWVLPSPLRFSFRLLRRLDRNGADLAIAHEHAAPVAEALRMCKRGQDLEPE